MVSIVIPIFNSAPYLSGCLASVSKQTIGDWEAILIDDASTDESAQIAASYCKHDQRFRLLHQPHNMGQSAARNLGMQHVKGEYLLFLDSDDALAPNYLEVMLHHIEDADVLQTGYKRIRLDGTITAEKCPSWHRRYVLTSPCMRLYRTAWLREKGILFEQGMIYEDVLFSARIWKEKPTIRVHQYTGYLYLINPHSTTSEPHDTTRIFHELKKLGIHPFQFNALRIRLRAHFIKEKLLQL